MVFRNHLGGSAFSLYLSSDSLKSYNIVTPINGGKEKIIKGYDLEHDWMERKKLGQRSSYCT